WRRGAASVQLVFDLLHGNPEVLAFARPTRRMDAGSAAKRIDRETGVVRERRQPSRVGGRNRLEARVLGKARTGLGGAPAGKPTPRTRPGSRRAREMRASL